MNAASDREADRRAIPAVASSLLALVPILILFAFALLDRVRHTQGLFTGFVGAGAILLPWNAALHVRAFRAGRVLKIEWGFRRQHYVQACAQGTVLVCWGIYWPPVREAAYLIAGQLAFAYAFDTVLAWSRRDTYGLGMAPIPVVFSVNLFLWFRPDWFYLQFLTLALGFTAKEFVRWNKEGRRVHIFNPSALPLAIASLVLIVTGRTDVTRGAEIAITQFYPPHMYLILFLIGLPGQYLFGVTSMTMSAAVTTYVAGLVYFAGTGTYFFFDSYIPIAVFLGMHLLFTDPSTSPRTEIGRILFGAAYALSTMGLYWLLGAVGVPTFYDKLLQVPLLNLSIKGFDRVARTSFLQKLDYTRWRPDATATHRHLMVMAVWALMFTIMSAAGGVGESHRGQWVPFWQQACRDDRPYACSHLADMLSKACGVGSGWACNEFGILQADVDVKGPGSLISFEAGCALRFGAACLNVDRARRGDRFVSMAPELADYPILVRGNKGPIDDRNAATLLARACRQGWAQTCGLSTSGQ